MNTGTNNNSKPKFLRQLRDTFKKIKTQQITLLTSDNVINY